MPNRPIKREPEYGTAYLSKVLGKDPKTWIRPRLRALGLGVGSGKRYDFHTKEKADEIARRIKYMPSPR